MSTTAEIGGAIEHLPPSKVDELATWFDWHRSTRPDASAVDAPYDRALGAAKPGINTASIMSATCGNE